MPMYRAFMLRTGGLLAAIVVTGTLAAACQSGPDLGENPDLAVVCHSARETVPNCVSDVTRLNAALTAALKSVLSSDASAVNNLRGTNGPVGGTGPTFHPRAEDGNVYYEAPMRLREGSKVANLIVVVDRWDILPEGKSCLMTAEAIAKEKSDGAVIHRCDRTEDATGTLLVSDISRPYRSGANAKILTRDFHVTVFRTDKSVVTVSMDTIVEKDPGTAKSGDLPTMLTLGQLLDLATSPALSL